MLKILTEQNCATCTCSSHENQSNLQPTNSYKGRYNNQDIVLAKKKITYMIQKEVLHDDVYNRIDFTSNFSNRIIPCWLRNNNYIFSRICYFTAWLRRYWWRIHHCGTNCNNNIFYHRKLTTTAKSATTVKIQSYYKESCNSS